MSPPVRWTAMESPVKPANDNGRVSLRSPSSLRRKPESRTTHPLDSGFRRNDTTGETTGEGGCPYCQAGSSALWPPAK